MIRLVPYLIVVLILSGTQVSFAQCPASVPPVAGPVITTESRCQSSGTATISVTGGTAPYTYSITSGPVIMPSQSSNTFQSLPPGSYTARITDFCSTQRNVNFTITGSYTVPQPVAILTTPSCQGGNNGTIKINVTNGRPPYSYALINPSPLTMPDQPGNTFAGLSAGNYTFRVTDSCGNFQTRNVVLADGTRGNFIIGPTELHYEGCDSFSIPVQLSPLTIFDFRPPYTLQLTLPNGSNITHVLTAAFIDSANGIVKDTIYFGYRHVSGSNSQLTLQAANNCGATASNTVRTAPLNLETQVTPIPDCSRQYMYTFDPGRDNNPANTTQWILHCGTITYKLVSAAGVVLATQINNSTFTGYPPANYKMIREDCCRKDTLSFSWATVAPLKISNYALYKDMVCKEGTVGLSLLVEPGIRGNIILASGPPAVTFANGTVHTYTYPDTLKNILFGNFSTHVNYFTTGTFKIYAMDSCGQKDSLTFTVTPADLRHSSFSASLVKGCTDANKILLQAQSNASDGIPDADIYVYPGDLQYDLTDYPFSDSAVNLSEDTYAVTYTYRARTSFINFLKGMSSYSCDMISQSIVVPAYQQPRFDSKAAIASCGVLRNVALLADSTKGVTPYQFQISSGPAATALQTTPVFSNLAAGTYPFLMADACGNSYSLNLSIDTLKVPLALATGNLCAGSTATLSLPENPYYQYQWALPGGSTVTGSSLLLNPVTPADTGTYKITATSTIAGCTDSKQSALNLQFCSFSVLADNRWNFVGNRRGDNMILKWQTGNEADVAYFVIERSNDGLHFNTWRLVPAASPLVKTYTITDEQPLPGISYYRMQVVYTNSLVRYSAIVSCTSIAVRKPTVYPTWVAPGVPLLVAYPASTQNVFVQLVTMDGKLLLTKVAPGADSQTNFDISQFTPGYYLVVVTHNGQKTVVRVLKQ